MSDTTTLRAKLVAATDEETVRAFELAAKADAVRRVLAHLTLIAPVGKMTVGEFRTITAGVKRFLDMLETPHEN